MSPVPAPALPAPGAVLAVLGVALIVTAALWPEARPRGWWVRGTPPGPERLLFTAGLLCLLVGAGVGIGR